nr:zinc finger CCCH domain-containing protein 1 [Ipomoea batatas]
MLSRSLSLSDGSAVLESEISYLFKLHFNFIGHGNSSPILTLLELCRTVDLPACLEGAILPVYVIYIILLPPMAEEPEKANSEDPQQTVTYRLTGDSERQLLAGDEAKRRKGEGREAVAGGSGLDVSGCRLSAVRSGEGRGSFRWLCGEDHRDAISGEFAERDERRSPVIWSGHLTSGNQDGSAVLESEISYLFRLHFNFIGHGKLFSNINFTGALLELLISQLCLEVAIWVAILPVLCDIYYSDYLQWPSEPEKANSEGPSTDSFAVSQKAIKGQKHQKTYCRCKRKKPTVADNKLHFSTGPSKREVTSESDAHSEKASFLSLVPRVLEAEILRFRLIIKQNTATLETEIPSFSKDARAIRERVLKLTSMSDEEAWG